MEEDNNDTSTSPPSEGVHPTASLLTFEFNLAARKNFFTLYLGSGITALFLLIAFLAVVKKRQHSVVVQLAKPDTDAHVHEYILMIKTAIWCGSGLTRGARVAVQLLGTYSDSKRYTLSQQVMTQDILQRAHVDIFVLYTHMDIGELQTIRFTLYNFSDEAVASWRPCYLEVMKSTSRQRWAVKVDTRIKWDHIITKSFPLIKGFRHIEGLWTLILKHHLATSPFFTAQRFGAYTSLTSVIYFFFFQSVLMISTLISLVVSHKLLGRLTRAEFLPHFFQDILPLILITSMVVSVTLQQLEMFLMNIRPSPSQKFKRSWKGLWRNDYIPNLMQCDIDYNWDRPPSEFKHWAQRFSSQTSLSSTDSPSEDSAEEKDAEEAVQGRMELAKAYITTKSPKIALKLLRYCTKHVRFDYFDQRHSVDKKEAAATTPSMLPTKVILFSEEKARVEGTTITELVNPGPGVFCQFCLWVKHLTIRGDDLDSYLLSMTHQIRTTVEALSVSNDPNVVIRVMSLCLHQWTSSMCTRMLKEAISTLDREKLDHGGLEHLHNALTEHGGNLWFSEIGYKNSPLACKGNGDNSRIVSTLYFTIMRNMVTFWRHLQKGHRGILRRTEREIFPPEQKKRKLQFRNKVHMKSIMKVADIIEMTDEGERLREQTTTDTVAEKAKQKGMDGDYANQSAGEKPITVCNQGRVLLTDSSFSDCGHMCARSYYQHTEQGGDVSGAAAAAITNNRLPCGTGGGGEFSRTLALSPPSVERNNQMSPAVVVSSTPLKVRWRIAHGMGKIIASRTSSQATQCRRIDAVTGKHSTNIRLRKRNTSNPAIFLNEGEYSDRENICHSHHRSEATDKNRCNSNSGIKSSLSLSLRLGDSTIRRMATKIENVFQGNICRFNGARPQTIFKWLAAFESYANIVQLEVKSLINDSSCFCCGKPLCQSYAVMYIQLKEYVHRIVYHLVAHCMATRHHHGQEVTNITKLSKKINMTLAAYLLQRAQWLQKMGRPQNEQALRRLEKETKSPDKKNENASSVDSFDSSNNNPVSLHDRPRNARRRYKRQKHLHGTSKIKKQYSGHKFGKRASHHGLIHEWTHIPYPFSPTLLPPLRVSWHHSQSSAAVPSHDSKTVKEEVDSDSTDKPTAMKAIHDVVKKLVHEALKEVAHEASWLLELKEALATVVAFARMEVMQEVQDPLKIAVGNFTHALVVMLFEALLPMDEEENFVVTPDDIRQRRKRVSSKRSPLFDLTESNNPGYDLDFLDFVVVKLCERWELAKLELQHQPTLQFLTRCLTFENLDQDLMTRLDHLILEHPHGIEGLVLDRLTHVHEMEHALAVMVNEVMAMTLIYVVPETLKAMKDVEGRFRNEEERVMYVCEKVSVMENQVRHKISRRVLKVAAQEVKDQLKVFARRQDKIAQRSHNMINKLRELVQLDYYYTQLSKDELEPIKKDLLELRHQVATIRRVLSFQTARSVRKYAQNTTKLKEEKTREALMSLTEDRNQDQEYTARQLAEVEWIMTGQIDKTFPALCMHVAVVFMFLVTLLNMILVTILGASFDPDDIQEWFELHLLTILIWIVVSEPFKCIWLLDFGWRQPRAPTFV